MKSALAAGIILLSASTAAAGEIEIDDPWVRASLGRSPNSAGYMTIRSETPDRLVGASSPLAARVTLHTTMEHAGVSQMRPLDAIEVGPGQPAVLQPGGLHLMLMGLSEPLEEGASLPLELTFERAGAVEIEALVRGLGVTGGHGHGAGG